MSRSHATYTRLTDYVGVLEEAAGLLDRAECHERGEIPPSTRLWVHDSRLVLFFWESR